MPASIAKKLAFISKTLLVASLVLFASFLIISPAKIDAAASIPYKINFQGRLTDSSGNIVGNGLYNIRFKIMNAPTAGTELWSESRQTTSRVQITNGLFDVRLGDVTPLSPELFNGTTQLYLEIELPSPATATCATAACANYTEGPLSPRQPIASSPYAFNADMIDGIDGTQLARVDQANSFNGNQSITGTLTATSILQGANQVCDMSGNCGVAAGSTNYIQNGVTSQTANFNISGNGTIGGELKVEGSAEFASIKRQYSKAFTVDPGGKGDYTTIGAAYAAAVAASPSDSNRVGVLIYPGIYDESISLVVDYISLIGSGRELTRVRRSSANVVLNVGAGVSNSEIKNMSFEQTATSNVVSMITISGSPTFIGNRVSSPPSAILKAHIDASSATGGVYSDNIFDLSTGSTPGGVMISSGVWRNNVFQRGNLAIRSMSGGIFSDNRISSLHLTHSTEGITGGTYEGNVWDSTSNGQATFLGGKIINSSFSGGSNAANAGPVNIRGGSPEFIGGVITSNSDGGAVKIYESTATPSFSGTKINSGGPTRRAFALATTATSSVISVSNISITGTVESGITLNGTFNFENNNAASMSQINTRSATQVGLTLKAASSQTADLLQLQNSSGAKLLGFRSNGAIESAGAFNVYTNGLSSPTLTLDALFGVPIIGLNGVTLINSPSASATGLIVKAINSQTADLAVFQNAAGTAIAGVRSDGRMYGLDGTDNNDYVTVAQFLSLGNFLHIQGGNSFGEKAVFGTQDNYGVDIVVNSSVVSHFGTSGDLYVVQSIDSQLGSIKTGGSTRISNTGVLQNVTADSSILTAGTLNDARLSSNVALKNAANTFTQAQTFQSSISATALSASGYVYMSDVVNIGNWHADDVQLFVQSSDPSYIAQRVRGAVSQAADIFQVQASGGSNYLTVSGVGTLTVSPAAGAYSLVVKDSAGNDRFVVDPSGKIIMGNGGYAFSALKRITTTWNPPSTANTATSVTQYAMPAGAIVVGVVAPAPPACTGAFGCTYSSGGTLLDNRGLQYAGGGSSTQYVQFVFTNATGAAVDPPNATWTIWYIEP